MELLQLIEMIYLMLVKVLSSQKMNNNYTSLTLVVRLIKDNLKQQKKIKVKELLLNLINLYLQILVKIQVSMNLIMDEILK